MNTIDQSELGNDLEKVIDAVSAGESFVVLRDGEPVAELRPSRSARVALTSREAVIALGGTGIDGHRFRADLDAVLDQTH